MRQNRSFIFPMLGHMNEGTFPQCPRFIQWGEPESEPSYNGIWGLWARARYGAAQPALESPCVT